MPTNPDIHTDTLFLDTLRHQRRGECLDELGETLRALIAQIRDRGTGGEISLSLKIKPVGATGDQIQIIDTIKVKEPKKPSTGFSLFFTDSECNLLRTDPNQPNLPFAPEIREAVNH